MYMPYTHTHIYIHVNQIGFEPFFHTLEHILRKIDTNSHQFAMALEGGQSSAAVRLCLGHRWPAGSAGSGLSGLGFSGLGFRV